jgi:hypothetical protein
VHLLGCFSTSSWVQQFGIFWCVSLVCQLESLVHQVGVSAGVPLILPFRVSAEGSISLVFLFKSLVLCLVFHVDSLVFQLESFAASVCVSAGVAGTAVH